VRTHTLEYRIVQLILLVLRYFVILRVWHRLIHDLHHLTLVDRLRPSDADVRYPSLFTAEGIGYVNDEVGHVLELVVSCGVEELGLGIILQVDVLERCCGSDVAEIEVVTIRKEAA